MARDPGGRPRRHEPDGGGEEPVSLPGTSRSTPRSSAVQPAFATAEEDMGSLNRNSLSAENPAVSPNRVSVRPGLRHVTVTPVPRSSFASRSVNERT